jgi:hypothetical protein
VSRTAKPMAGIRNATGTERGTATPAGAVGAGAVAVAVAARALGCGVAGPGRLGQPL